jgi:3-oxoacyl-[acyl-carrier-protein] synthase II
MPFAPKAQDSPEHTIVITGVGAVTPLGIGFEATRSGLRAGRSGIVEQPRAFAADRVLAALRACELPELDPAAILGKKGLRSKDRLTLMLLCCIAHDLGRDLERLSERDEVGLVAGTTFSGLNSQIDFTSTYERGGMRALNATTFPNMVLNTAPSQANIWFGLTGMSVTVTNGFTAGLDAVIFAADQLRSGRARQLIAGGVDELAAVAAQAFAVQGYLSRSGQLRPFDARHDGTLLGEGAAVMLLETRASAEARGATVIGELLGYAGSFDGDATAPLADDAGGAARAMSQALRHAELEPNEIDFIAASGSGYPPADRLEARAIEQVFGSQMPPVVAYKGAFGECLGASGALQLVAALADLHDGIVSASRGFEQSDGGGLPVQRDATRSRPQVAMVNAVGYTGSNTSLILRATTEVSAG